MPWDLFFTLPNLAVPVPSPFMADDVCVCAAEDDRLQDLMNNRANRTARRMLDNFSTYRGEAYRPACFLVNAAAGENVRRSDTLRGFRNLCAIASTTFGSATVINGGQWIPRWSDHFQFGRFAAGHNGWIQPLDGPWSGTDDQIPRLQSSPAIGRPSNWTLTVDQPLWSRLVTCWRQFFLRRRDVTFHRPLFRALEVAFHAALYPADGLTSINDVGTRIGLWVSAFEILCHPATGNANKLVVLRALDAAPLDAPYQSKRYRAMWGGQTHRVGLAADIYDDLYAARNAFMHGNQVTAADVRYRRSRRRLQLTELAPIVFNVALLSYLEGHVAGGPQPDDRAHGDLLEYVRQYHRRRAGIDVIQNALRAAKYDLNEHGRPAVPDA